ncbi:MAG: efflux RND transporter permease subunit [Thermoanaerobaculales bacterium]|jgi:HAE1 family hydrophobic/amphiphilic exporter-1|nr:efflux RND transporter permease subunit [Thermoanaerobaculales bacterium]
MTLPELAIRRPVAILTVLVCAVVLGLVALERLPLGFMPEVEEPVLFVQVPFPNATPEQTERLVVRPLEEALGSVKGVTEMWSTCDTEGGRVRLSFAWGHEMSLARAEVIERVDRIRRDLPDTIGDIRIGGSWDAAGEDSPVLEGRLSSKRDLSESYDLLERKIVRPIERIPGVASVSLDGVNPKEVRINLRVEDLEAHGVDVREVAAAIQGANFDLSAGVLRSDERRLTVRTVGAFSSVEEIRSLPLRGDGLRLSDVADIRYEEPPLEYGRHLDGDFAIGVTVIAEAGGNAVEIGEQVRQRVAEMNDDPELEGVTFLIWFDQGAEIEKTLSDLSFTGFFGALLASVVLFVFLRRVSMTLVSVLCIPFSLIVACGAVWAMGKTMNTLTLLGLIVGVGMLVDNAVVVMENIYRHQQRGLSRTEAALVGSREVSLAVIAATLTSVIVFLPMIFNKPSEMNIYLRELAITVCLTLLASLFISQTLIPLATSTFIRSRSRGRARLMLWLEDRYERLLGFFLRRRWLTPVIGLAVIASTWFPFDRIDKNFDAGSAEVFVQIRYEFAEPLSLERKEAAITLVEELLVPHREELEAEHIYSFWSDRFSLTRLYMKEDSANEAAMADTRARLRGLLPELPGIKLEVQDQAGWGWRRGAGKRIAFQLVGEDTGVLAELAEEAKLRLEEIPGLSDAWTSTQEGGMELHVDLDRELAAHYGVPLNQPAEVVSLTFRGRRMPRFRTPSGEREMRLTLDERDTESLDQLHTLPVWTADGDKIPLASLAEFRVEPGPDRIQRDNRRTSVWVGARYDEGTMDDYLPLVRTAMDAMDFPFGYTWTMSEWAERQREQSREFLVNLLLALGLVFAVMAGLFESVRQAVGLMVALPFALAGAFWALWMTGTDFDQPAAVGLLLLIGVVVNNGIVMIEHINLYRRQGMERTAAMLTGGRERLRPILMTAITTLVGLVPIVVQRPSLGGVYYYSMAIVIMGGLVVSTFLTTLLLPTTAALSEDTFAAAGRLATRAWQILQPWKRRPAEQ